MLRPLATVAALALATLAPVSAGIQGDSVLVFSKTAGFRHASIGDGVEAIRKLGDQHGFSVQATEDAAAFTDDNLRAYDAVVFLNTTGDVLDDAQQASFERYIRAGGAWVGVHAATDTEYDWPWYGRLAGARFDGHPAVQQASLTVVDGDHPATASLPATWARTDEWYDFRSINPEIHVLITIDESSYEGAATGEPHPMSWYHELDGGRAFYTAAGHTPASYTEPLYLEHLAGGIRWALRR